MYVCRVMKRKIRNASWFALRSLNLCENMVCRLQSRFLSMQLYNFFSLFFFLSLTLSRSLINLSARWFKSVKFEYNIASYAQCWWFFFLFFSHSDAFILNCFEREKKKTQWEPTFRHNWDLNEHFTVDRGRWRGWENGKTVAKGKNGALV